MTIYRFLKPLLSTQPRNITSLSTKSNRHFLIDIGVGNDPWAKYVHSEYIKLNLDIPISSKFEMHNTNTHIFFDGMSLPISSECAKVVMLIKVLEHAKSPSQLLKEINRIIHPGGTLLLSVPFSARRHHIPYDFQRYTREGLDNLLINSGFSDVTIYERGNDLDVIFNKVEFNIISLYQKIHLKNIFQIIIMLIFLLPFALVLFLFINFPFISKLGNDVDPLGHFVVAIKSTND